MNREVESSRSGLPLPDGTSELDQQKVALDELTYAISHDLPAPVRALHGYLTALREEHGSELSEGATQYVLRLGRAVQRIEELLAGFEEYSRALRAELHPVPIDVSRLFTEILQSLRERTGIPFTSSVDGGIHVVADRALLHWSLSELANNALKFVSSTQPPHLELLALSRSGAGAVFGVRDNGVGFDAGLLNRSDGGFRLFRRFHPQSQFTGTGVGLACVRAILARHGGELRCESSPGAGATFVLTLP